jgi:hypothetical protein
MAKAVVDFRNENGLRWQPGQQGGHVVPVQFNLPIKFKLE